MADHAQVAEPLVVARGLKKEFGSITALAGIDLEIRAGEFVALFGPNGAGKTTLIKVLSTLVKPSAGRVAIMGRDAFSEGKDLRRLIGLLSHSPFLYPHLTAQENLEFYGRMYAVSDLRKQVDQLLRDVGLWERRHHPVKTFSFGMVRRLAIARGLVHRPRVILLDEPYAGLDQQAVGLLHSILAQLHTPDRAILLVTHELRRGLELCDRVLIQAAGRIVHQASARETDPAAVEEIYQATVGGEI